ncbi:inner membrane transporter RhtA [Bowdeniella nasicola]|uniref:Inner membrane transporter RhtA n=1 Tax=Bowdeniella nasicola TaxID=208480 RepID=A0A1H4A9E3_9ACTO|nr:inner membrane transporter RhtA [Bowdeniella nasicola]
MPPWLLAVLAMLSVQLSGAFAVGLIEDVGPRGAAWLRVAAGAVLILLIARPKIRGLTLRDAGLVTALGVTTGSLTFLFFVAIQRIPLGTAVALEFLGPLVLAAVTSTSRRALAYPALAMIGVVLLTRPWIGDVDLIGILFALGSGTAWAFYIILTQRAGDRFSGISALAYTIPIAAIAYAPIGLPEAIPHLSVPVIATALGLALLMPVIPLAFEIVALRAMAPAAFGTLMALEPAMSIIIGAIVLAQVPLPIQVLGIVLVVAAGIGSQRFAARDVSPTPIAWPESDEA